MCVRQLVDSVFMSSGIPMDMHVTLERTFKILDDYLGEKLEKPKLAAAASSTYEKQTSSGKVKIEDVTSEEEEGVSDKASKMKKPKT
jgi:hypothetical protein